MEAVHFGAGNIGRGFIGALLYEANYHTTFVDVNEDVIQALNDKQQYDVVLAAENKDTLTVKNVSGINSMEHPDQVVEAIVHADIITTAVGANVLPIIAEIISKGLLARIKRSDQSLNIIACENMIGGSTLLKEAVMKHISETEQSILTDLIGFPDAAVDRIVPNQDNVDPLEVSVEPFYEWVVDQSAIKGDKPAIDGIYFVQTLTPYIERKLFTVNTGHATVAYIGHYMGYETIKEAMDDAKVQDIVRHVLYESGEAIIQTYDFERSAHRDYINKIIERFTNPYISDEVTRVGRNPIRKLGAQDRLIRPATVYAEVTGKQPVYLAKVIASVLNYVNKADEEAVKLQQLIEDHGYEQALQTVANLDQDDPLISLVMQEMENIKTIRE